MGMTLAILIGLGFLAFGGGHRFNHSVKALDHESSYDCMLHDQSGLKANLNSEYQSLNEVEQHSDHHLVRCKPVINFEKSDGLSYLRPPFLTNLREEVASIADRIAKEQELLATTWSLTVFDPDQKIGTKVAKALKTELVIRKIQVLDHNPFPLAHADSEFLSDFVAQCEINQDQNADLGNIIVSRFNHRLTQIFAAICHKGRWQWL
jgi:hypothetical protein